MNYNYQYLIKSPKKQLQPQITIKYNTAINLDQIPKFQYRSPRNLTRQITNLSPTIQLNRSKNKQTVESKSQSPLMELNLLNINKIKKKIDLFQNLNYGNPKIFHKLSPDQMIPSQLSIPITKQHVEKNIIIKKKSEPDRIARSNTQYSVRKQDIKCNISSSRMLQKRQNKKEPSGELKGWQGQFVEYFDDFI